MPRSAPPPAIRLAPPSSCRCRLSRRRGTDPARAPESASRRRRSRSRRRARAASGSGSPGLVEWRAAPRRPGRPPARRTREGLCRGSSSLALLAHRAALELELDVPELDDVVVDQVVLLHLL